MNKKLPLFILLLSIAASLSFSGIEASANQGTQSFNDDKVLSQYLIPLLEALKNHDIESMYEVWVEQPVSDKNDLFFNQLFEIWDRRTWKSIEKGDTKIREAEGDAPSAVVYGYTVMCDEEDIDIEFAVSDTSKSIDALSMTRNAHQIIGTLGTWRQFNLAQWLFTGVAAAELVFSLYMAFHCIKKKPRLWGLWLAFILTVYAGIAFPTQGDLIISFFVRTFSFPKILKYRDLGMKIFISIPIGAVMYYIKYEKRRGKE